LYRSSLRGWWLFDYQLLASEWINAGVDLLIRFVPLHHDWLDFQLSFGRFGLFLFLLLNLIFFLVFVQSCYICQVVLQLRLLLVPFIFYVLIKDNFSVFLLNDKSFFIFS